MICCSLGNKNFEELLSILNIEPYLPLSASSNFSKQTLSSLPLCPLIEMAEIRLDTCPLSLGEVAYIFSKSRKALIATCRKRNILKQLKKRDYFTKVLSLLDFKYSKSIAKYALLNELAKQIVKKYLLCAIENGAAYLDLEHSLAKDGIGQFLIKQCRKYKVKVIISYHNFSKTESSYKLKKIKNKCFSLGADLPKIVCFAKRKADVERILSLYVNSATNDKILAFAMGSQGSYSRMDSLKRGVPFLYASLGDGEETAEGQLPLEECYRQLYGYAESQEDEPFYKKIGNIDLPSSKSIAQRVIIAAALAEGTSHIDSHYPCEDTLSAISFIEKIGARVKVDEDKHNLIIEGIGAKADTLSIDSLSVGESALLSRIAIPLLTVLNKDATQILLTGEKTLLNRALKGVNFVVKHLNASVVSESKIKVYQSSEDELYLPISIKKNTENITNNKNIELNQVDSSQLVSGLLMALPLVKDGTSLSQQVLTEANAVLSSHTPSKLSISNPKSFPYIALSLSILKLFSINIDTQAFFSVNKSKHIEKLIFTIKGEQKYLSQDVVLEKDWSGAANFIVAGAIFGEVTLNDLNINSLQADRKIIDIVKAAGAKVYIGNNSARSGQSCTVSAKDTNDNINAGAFKKSFITVSKAPLTAFDVDITNSPDLAVILAVLAVFCQGISTIRGLERLVNKESDRAQSICEMLSKMGVSYMLKDSTISIQGYSLSYRKLNNLLIKGGPYSSYGDHRLVMALKVAELGAAEAILIDNSECVKKSFPDFLKYFE